MVGVRDERQSHLEFGLLCLHAEIAYFTASLRISIKAGKSFFPIPCHTISWQILGGGMAQIQACIR